MRNLPRCERPVRRIHDGLLKEQHEQSVRMTLADLVSASQEG
jgi:hypothetical protein